ncbi:glycerophosphoryl diester phosphodiesterase membrane domain-containing protein [Nocardiopsis ansamitocini]|uniref:Glycerophosphoryl diester phosphodiesterase membrane domain-containing protein n=1 Tax=Nocardiopsis ansamitocini TaxID=1670832 RepID=A0A9W6P8R7_9ACTN|nr:glycerophosphoryl diester phosphodiesterase membrane domain-containing protein [Nocardiopsis ansamitocini]GLU49664.1 hypothetical protein Nans01_40150 [Nocardiopsis ansamitocini]
MSQEDGQAWRAPGDRQEPADTPQDGPWSGPQPAQPPNGGWEAPPGVGQQPFGAPVQGWGAPPGNQGQYGPPPGGQGPYGPPPGDQGWGAPPGGPAQPGYGPPPGAGAPHGWGPQGPYPWAPYSAPRPGVIALRPLSLGDIFNGAFGYVRHNPGATIGIAFIVMAVSGLISTLGTGSLLSEAMSFEMAPPPSDEVVFPFSLGSMVSLFAGLVVQLVAGSVLLGLLTGVLALSVLGRRVSFKEAFSTVRGRVGAILGLTGLTFVFAIAAMALFFGVIVLAVALGITQAPVAGILAGLLGVVLAVALTAWLATKISLAMPAIVLERIGPFPALARSWRLTSGSFWRILGILLLANLIISFVSGLLQTPFTIVGTGLQLVLADPTAIVIATLATNFVATAVATALTTPFSAGASALLYLDMRMRREGLDLRLQQATQSGHQVGPEVYLTGDRPGAPF